MGCGMENHFSLVHSSHKAITQLSDIIKSFSDAIYLCWMELPGVTLSPQCIVSLLLI